MKRLLVVFLLLLSNMAVGNAMADAIGTVVANYGTASASGPGGNRALSSGSPLFEHDKITVVAGTAQIQLLDGTKLVVGSNSALVLEKFLMRGGATAQNVSVDALRGTFRFITGNSPKNAYDIKTANATIAIRGTGFDFWVAERTGVALLKGKVRLCSKKGGSCINLEPNCSIGVAGDPNPAHLIHGSEKTSTIGRRLPYLVDQTSLRSQFRLSTLSCSRDLPQQSGSHAPGPSGSTAPPRIEEGPGCGGDCGGPG
jgi:hypothetical protein